MKINKHKSDNAHERCAFMERREGRENEGEGMREKAQCDAHKKGKGKQKNRERA